MMPQVKVPTELTSLPLGTVIQCHSSWNQNAPSEPITLAGPFTYVDASDPLVFEAWGLNAHFMPDLITWDVDAALFVTGSSDGGLDDMTNEQLVDKATELKIALNLV